MGLDNPIHIAFLLILLLLVFGAKRLPEMGRSLGDGMRGFKDAISGENPPTAQPMAQPAALVAQPQTQEAAPTVQQVPVQQVPVQQVPAPVQAVPTPQPVMEKLPA
jgi:sec-independent protein translocase protein TatA